ncbi:MAG: arsenate reductase ArsC [Armatimonadota bacterium]|nr:arsenate reductase ArsC [Armatimonadota bacterium]MDR7564040.1 arsenate reductase ArsC [Armatimonadota bacterium]MDR7602251.1 arsenate reductase ArsC [Armatimonadota bacterium]
MRVLFLCTGNSARSQMAEGWLRHLSRGMVEVWSAGTEPRGLHPMAVQAMAEVGIDISGHASKSVEGFAGQSFDWVITVCDRARESCPVFPGVRTLHWSIPDPAAVPGTEEEALAAFRAVREELRWRILRFLDGLLAVE